MWGAPSHPGRPAGHTYTCPRREGRAGAEAGAGRGGFAKQGGCEGCAIGLCEREGCDECVGVW